MGGTRWKRSKEVVEWHALLKPWLSALRDAELRCDNHTWTKVSDIDKLWFSFSARDFHNSNAAWLLRVEAMELLELLARVGRQIAWGLIINRGLRWCDVSIQMRLREISQLSRFQIKVDCYESPEREDDIAFKRLLTLWTLLTTHSATYDGVKRMLLAQWCRTHNGLTFNRTKGVEVEVVPDKVEKQTTLFARIEQLDISPRTGREATMSGNSEANHFALNSVAFAGYCLHFASNGSLQLFGRMKMIGIRILFFHFGWLDATTSDANIWSDFLKSFISSTQGIAKLSFSVNQANLDGMDGICLAMAHSPSFREVGFICAGGAVEEGFARFLWRFSVLRPAMLSTP